MWGIYYNELFDSLLGIQNELATPVIEVHENLTLFKDESNNVVGFNVFKVSQSLSVKQSFSSFDEEVLSFLKTRLEKYFNFSQQAQFVVGHVEQCEDIVDTHLHNTKVKIGSDQVLNIVCGASNIATDQYVVVALPGAWMPNGLQIKPGKLRGFESSGMITSARELQLVEHEFNQQGIIELPTSYSQLVGKDFFAIEQDKE